ncbi:hypothetical protein Tco_0552415, partial [Tanacetum coccineum]
HPDLLKDEGRTQGSLEVSVGVTKEGEAVCEIFLVRVLATGSAFPWTRG